MRDERGVAAGRLAVWVCVVVLAGVVGLSRSAAAAPPVAVERWTMPNGLVVLLVERHTIPAVEAHLVIKTGAVADPSGREGLAALTADLLTKGTATRSAVEIAEAIDFIGGSLTAQAADDFSSLTLTTLKKDLPTAVGVMADVLLHAAFPAAEVERQRRETLSGIQGAKDDPEDVAEKAFAPLVFGPHPYRHPVEGLDTTVPLLTREEVVAFHRTYYRPNNAILALVGDLGSREARRAVKAALGGWEKKAIPPLLVPPAPPIAEKTVSLIEKDLTQATIVLGHLGIARNDPDFYPVTVMNYILGGGGFASRLMTTIRDNRGLVYGISSGFDAKRFPGSFSVSLQTKTASADEAIGAALDEIRRIREEGVADAELRAAQDYLAGSFPLRLDTNAKLARLLAAVEFYDLGLGYFEDYPRAIRAVTLDDVRRVAAAHLDPERYVLVVVGKTRELALAKTARPAAGSPAGP
jgi:zinc protease